MHNAGNLPARSGASVVVTPMASVPPEQGRVLSVQPSQVLEQFQLIQVAGQWRAIMSVSQHNVAVARPGLREAAIQVMLVQYMPEQESARGY